MSGVEEGDQATLGLINFIYHPSSSRSIIHTTETSFCEHETKPCCLSNDNEQLAG